MGSGALVWNGNVVNNMTANGAVFSLKGTGAGVAEFAGLITNNGANTLRLMKTEAGTWKVSGANTFTGLMDIFNGTLQATTIANSGTASSIGAGTTIRFGGFAGETGVLEYVGTGSTNNKQFKLGGGGTANTGGTILNNGTGALVFNNATFNPTGDGTFSGTTRELTLGGTNVADNTISGIIANNAGSGNVVTVVKTGAGKWILSGNNTYTGGTTLNAGTLQLAGQGTLGASSSAVSVTGGSLDLGGLTRTNASFTISNGSLTNGTLQAATYQLNGGAVAGNLGTGTVNANSGTTALHGTVGAATLNVGGGTLNFGSAGRLAVGATVNVTSGTLSTGGNETITRLNATGGTVNLTGDTLTVTGTGANQSSIGSSATATGGTINVQGTLDYQASSGTTALSVASGGTLSGSGTTSGSLLVDGTLAPGNSTGIMYVGSTTFLGGGTYKWEIDTFGGVVGTNWDFLNITGDLTISASSGDLFMIDVVSLLAANDQGGPAANFTFTNSYSFAIATASGVLQGFDAGAFAINTAGFQNAMTAEGYLAGSWSVSQSGKSLMLNYTGATAIPEPNSASLMLLGLGLAYFQRRRNR
jgi:fibronectin-binding autotransporter adhesin